jgi:uncharacterized protein (DUF427 family)/class 3 adenylate cyclase
MVDAQSSAADSRADAYRIDLEPAPGRVRVVFEGVAVADSARALILHETRHPPVYYVPRDDVRMELLLPTGHRTHCPFKGDASYWTLRVGERSAENAAWAYEEPVAEAAGLRGHLAFYRERVDAVTLGGEPPAVWSDAPHAVANPLVDWLVGEAWREGAIDGLVEGLAHQLLALGVSVVRVNLIVRTLHPQVAGTLHLWRSGADGVERIDLTHAGSKEERFLSSPFIHIFEGRGGVRRPLEDGEARLDFPILADLRREGATDYVAMPLAFSDGQIHALTLATGRPGGFATAHLGLLHEVLPLFARLVEGHALRRTARTLLDTYLGVGTGGRVLEGRIRRGDGEVIPAVIWWADLRGSTALAERLPRGEYLELLNRFFESTAGAAIDWNGEVLKFIGDAVLAIFPVLEDGLAPVQALQAAREAVARIRRFNAEHAGRAPELAVALALHLGEVNYGNIGVEGRLDFTVTGPAVNQVARLEQVSKRSGKWIVASSSFARLVPDEVVSLGEHELRGVPAPLEVFTLRELA